MAGSTSVYVALLLSAFLSVSLLSVNGQNQEISFGLSINVGATAMGPTLISRLLIDNTIPSVLLNGPAAKRLMIPAGSQVIFDSVADSVAITGSVSPGTIPAQTYQYYVIRPGGVFFREFTTEDNTADDGPGTLFYDGNTALFINDDQIISVINGLNLPAPILPTDPPTPLPPLPQVSISYLRRANQLVLNLNDKPGQMTTIANDVIELTGSKSITIQTGETMVYGGGTVRYRRGSVTRGTFSNINSLVVLSDLKRGSETGKMIRRFTTTAGEVFNGPGQLITGQLQGQNVAFFTTSSTSGEITRATISQQLAFSTQSQADTAQVTDIFTTPGSPTSLIELSGSRSVSYATANSVMFNNGVVTVMDRFGQRLGRISGVSLNAFIDNQITKLGTSASGSFDIPEGGVTLIEKSGQTFIYPKQNSVISNGISSALSQIERQVTKSVKYSLQSRPNGEGDLSGNENILVTVTSGATIDLSSSQSLAYDGTTLSVFNQASPSSPIASYPVMSFSVSETPTSLETYNSSAPLNRDINGPGRLFVDNQGRAFFTNSQQLQSTVTSFINSLPPARISIVTQMVNQTSVVNLENGGKRLVEVSSSSVTTLPSQTSLIYNGNTVYNAQGFIVPSSSSLTYNVTSGITTITSSDGTQTSFASSSFRSRNVPQGTSNLLTTTTTLAGGGFFYPNPSTGDVEYTMFNTVDSTLVEALRGNAINDVNTIPNVDDFNFFDGRRVVTFTGSSSNIFSGPGSLFTANNQAFFSTDTALNTRIPNVVSQLLPSSVTFNSTTGVISITSGTGMPVSTFTVSTSRTGTLSPRSTVTYSNGVLTAPTVFGSNDTFMVTSLTIFNGIESRVVGPGESVTLMGPGQLVIDSSTGKAIFTTDDTTSTRIMQRVASVMQTFVAPLIPRPSTDEVTSKFRNVQTSFGRLVNVYAGANVDMVCRSSGNPMPTFTFFANNTLINATDDTDKYTITQMSATEVVLSIANVARSDAVRYTCVVENIVGRFESFTDLRVRFAEAPMIVNRYFPVSSDLPGVTITARTTNPPYTRSVIIGSTQSRVPITTTRVESLANLACKAEGRPKAQITWSAVDSNGAVVAINQSHVMVPREGRSILRVQFDQTDTRTIIYTCTAANEGGQTEGQVRVVPSVYSCETTTAGPCSATCGIGVQSDLPADCTVSTDNVASSVVTSDLPTGLFQTTQSLCLTGVSCPIITYEFNDELAFGPCSRTCNCGIQTRNVSCFMVLNGVRENTTTDVLDCINFEVAMPSQQQTCNNFECPRWEIQGDFSPCSSTCAGGTRERNVTCMQRIPAVNMTTGEPILDADGNPVLTDTEVDADDCLADIMPRSMEMCNTQIPCPHRWTPGLFGECGSDFCQVRTITCRRFDPTDPDEVWIVDNALCEIISLPPHTVRSCGGGLCNRGMWRAESFDTTTCSATCGRGGRTRDVACTARNDSSMVIENGFCRADTRPKEFEICVLFNCPGQCDTEPSFCAVLRILRMCKNDRFIATAEQCCKSCPLQAKPITLPPTFAPSDISVGLDMDMFSATVGQNLEVCCVASSISDPTPTTSPFLSLDIPCMFSANIDGASVERSANLGRKIGGTRACVTFPTAALSDGASFDVNLKSMFGSAEAQVVVGTPIVTMPPVTMPAVTP